MPLGPSFPFVLLVRSRLAASCCLLWLAFAAALPVGAQCEPQWAAGDPPADLVGTVRRMITWDPDGAGPEPAVLVCAGGSGGAFPDEARVAMFDGTRWTLLGSLAGFGTNAWALASFNGQLIVALDHYLATWTGGGWQVFATVDGVEAMHVYGGELYIGGSFTYVGITTASHVARWNGTYWSSLLAGLNGNAKAFATFQNVLYVGGSFSTAGGNAAGNLAIWNGVTWVATASANGPVTTMATRIGTSLLQTYLFVGGSFTSLGGAAQHVARFSPSANTWTGLGALPGLECVALGVKETGISSYELVATISDSLNDFVYRWNAPTSAWVAFGRPFYQYPPTCLGLWAGQYVVGVAAPGLLAVHHLAATGWQPLAGQGILGDVHAVLADGAETILGGQFTTISGATRNGIARGTPGNWSPLGSAFGATGVVLALVRMPNGDIVAGGFFTTADGQPANHIARWNGSTWSPLGSGTANGILALAVQPNGDLIAGGYFVSAGGVPANHIARWDGVGWSSLGGGCNNVVTSLAAMANGDVIAGGLFTDVGQRIARWNGANWSPMGAGAFGADVPALAELPGGDVLAAGSFAGVASTVARWNGSTWLAVESQSPGPSFAPTVLRVLSDGDVVAAGATGMARLHGGVWTSLGSAANILAVDQGDDGVLRVGGRFEQIANVDAARFVLREVPCPATATAFASGCASSGGANLLAATTLPWTDTTFRATGTGLPTTAIVLAVTSIVPVVPPLPLAAVLPEGMPGCDLHVAPDIVEVMLTTNGMAQSQLYLPNVPPLVGVTFYHQMLPIELDAFGGFVAITATNALQLTAGIF